MTTTKTDETPEVVEDIKDVTPDVEEVPEPDAVAEAAEVDVDDEGLPSIESLEDVKVFLNEGIDKIRDSSIEEVKTGALKVANRILGKLRKLTEDD